MDRKIKISWRDKAEVEVTVYNYSKRRWLDAQIVFAVSWRGKVDRVGHFLLLTLPSDAMETMQKSTGLDNDLFRVLVNQCGMSDHAAFIASLEFDD